MRTGSGSARKIAAARYRGSYFEPDGALRFQPGIRHTSLSERLRRSITLTASDRAEAAAFVDQLLTIDPAIRSTAAVALADCNPS
jgi:hypothetical protein